MKIEWDKINLVTQTQSFLHQHRNEEIDFTELSKSFGYSEVQFNRIFKQYYGMTLREYLRRLRLTDSAKRLLENQSGIEAALDANYQTHEGFIKAFKKEFGKRPGDFSKKHLVIPFFRPEPLKHYYIIKYGGDQHMSNGRTVTVLIKKKEAHKLILKCGIKSQDYFAYCEEIGCEIWGLLDSVKDKLDKVAFTENLPLRYVKPGMSRTACCVEVPLSYSGEIPDGCDIIEIPECEMAYFQGLPYEDSEWFGCAHMEVDTAIQNFKPEIYGYRYDYEIAPELCFGASCEEGCRNAVPIVKIL